MGIRVVSGQYRWNRITSRSRLNAILRRGRSNLMLGVRGSLNVVVILWCMLVFVHLFFALSVLQKILRMNGRNDVFALCIDSTRIGIRRNDSFSLRWLCAWLCVRSVCL